MANSEHDPDSEGNGDTQNRTTLAQHEHRLRVREILLDKLILALLIGAAAFYGNFRLTQYEKSLDSELEKLKAAYNLERILIEREILAHENLWKEIIAFRKVLHSYYLTPFNNDKNEIIKEAGSSLIAASEFESLYLSKETMALIKHLYVTDFPEFRRRWMKAEGSVMQKATWEWYSEKIEEVRTAIAAEIHARQPTQK